MNNSRNIIRETRRGVVAVELACILPVLTLIVLGSVDFGRFLHSHIAVTNAARAGAGYGIMQPYTSATQSIWQANVRSAVLDEMRQVIDRSGRPDSDVTVTTSRVVEKDGLQRISVEVSFPFQALVPWPGIPRPITLRRAIVMRVIR